MATVNWKFSGSEAAKEAASASLGTYTSQLYDLCDPKGKTILPPRSEYLETSPTAEKAVVFAVLCGKGNAYAPSIGLPVAKNAVAEYLNRDLPNKLTADDVFMTVGCKQAIELAVDILAKPNANVLLPSPGYPWEVVRSIYKKLEIRYYDFKKNFEIDLERVKQIANENTFAIFIINPHNPNGNTYSKAHLKQIAELAKELGILVVSDEVFRWTVFGSNPFVPMGTFSSIAPVVTLGSISKGWNVPGWRTGWLALHDLKTSDGTVFSNTKILQAAREFLEINSKPATVIQAAIPNILEKTPKEFFDTRRNFLKEKVDLGYSKLEHIPGLTCEMKPEACTFLWTIFACTCFIMLWQTKLNLSSFVNINNDQEFCKKLAEEENLVVLPGIAFSQENWLRHSIDMETTLLEDAFERLKSFCERHSTKVEAPLKDVNGVN